MTAETLRWACIFFKKIKIFASHDIVLVKTFLFMYQLATNIFLSFEECWRTAWNNYNNERKPFVYF